MKQYILIFLIVPVLFCQKDKEEYDRDQAIRLLASAFNETKADCVYCTDTQAFQGNCTCFTEIPVWSCQGYSSGRQKSNSIKVSCADLTSKGIWTGSTEVSEDPDAPKATEAKSCSYLTCPPEAYRAAFTPDGI
ncbi:hypothetical protein HGB47_20235 [Leptospira yasudae]|uniref:Uncharacterized protein n=1 Tax=Leptospira yasudae TaxID=2202201 RepID=A0ABX9M575_9LEPT|nr:hypothetical protein [Leptospira yasudae]MBW0435940.1 hypothetical protein [Leptospira yasudae]RHX80890.1 hypothetical protein DLM77_08440 [Leptospira yasudae]TGK24046.1 hypothetical protein EHQ05_13940 [Leptospira yasudae]TGM00655.1 hypothetical protein EHQ86_18840 [Leptospira yasudae]